MAKFKVALPDGRTVEVEGTIEEVERLLASYAGPTREAQGMPLTQSGQREAADRPDAGDADVSGPDVAAIVSKIKNCDEAEKIESMVLDKKSVLNRVLMPLYILNKYFPGSAGLTSGDVERITKQLGVPIAVANASKTLSETARGYVDGDKVRRRGSAVRYKLVRRGVQYFEGVLTGSAE